MPELSYKELKTIYQRSAQDFRAEVSGTRGLVKAVIKTLAHANYDNGCPLEC